MPKFNIKLDDSEFAGKKIVDQRNPLNGTVEENKAKFDAYPNAILAKLKELTEELNEKLSNVDNTADKDKEISNKMEEAIEEINNRIEGIYSVKDDGFSNNWGLLNEPGLYLVMDEDCFPSIVLVWKTVGNDELITKRTVISASGDWYELDKDLLAIKKTVPFRPEDKAKLEGLEDSISNAIAELVGSAPKALDTLEELSKALGDDGNFASTVTNLLSKKVEKVEGKGLSTEDFTTELKEKLEGLENYDDTELRSTKENIDDVNLKIYGTTDVHILTDDDIWITEDGIFEAQKVERIDYEVVIIPHGVRHIIPKEPICDDDSNEYYYEEGVYPIWINAKKIICPNTLVNIYGTLSQDGKSFCNATMSGDFVLSEGVQIINMFDDTDCFTATEIGNIKIPQTLKSFTVWDYKHDITIPHNINKFSFWSGEPLMCNLYVYNPNFDFSDFTTNAVFSYNTDSGTIYGYAGSTAEAFAKEHGYTFKNLGSAGGGGDIGDIETALDRIIEIQEELLGGDNK